MTQAASRAVPPMTVRRMLRLRTLRAGLPLVLAGRDVLDRHVRWVHVGEVPHIGALLKGKEVLLVTGMGIGRSPAEQRHYVAHLAERNVAGIILELGVVWREAPEAAVAEAESRRVPFVILRKEIPCGHPGAAGGSGEPLRHGGAPRVGGRRWPSCTSSVTSTKVARTIANPVLLVKDGSGVLYPAAYRSEVPEALNMWRELETGVISAHNLSEPPVVVSVRAAPESSWGRLIALPIDSQLDDFDRMTVERAVSLVSLALARDSHEAVLALRQRGKLLADLANRRVTPEEAALKSEAAGFSANGRVLVPIAVRPAAQLEGVLSIPVWHRVVAELTARGIASLIGVTEAGMTLVLLALRDADERRDLVSRAVEIIRRTAGRHEAKPTPLTIAAGVASSDWDALRDGLKEAMELAELMRTVPGSPWHDVLEPGIAPFVYRLAQDELIRRFVDRRLAPVLEYDLRRNTQLLATLEAVLDNPGRKTEAARVLNLTRQTLYYRLGRIQQLLDADLDDGEVWLALHLALRLHRLSSPLACSRGSDSGPESRPEPAVVAQSLHSHASRTTLDAAKKRRA